MKFLVASTLLVVACGSDAASFGSACPSVAGTWTVTAHCVGSFVGQAVVVTQNDCAITTSAPFNGFTGTIASDGKLDVTGPAVTGPETCTGTTTSNSVALSCSGSCAVTLSR